jgi:capsular polysaccharide biosynthesis protein
MNRKRFIVTGSVLTALGVLFLFVATTSLLITLILPESYRSTARIVVERISPEKSAQPPSSVSTGPSFIPTEIERIQQSAVLNEVITNLGLNKKWAAKFKADTDLSAAVSFSLLKRQLDVRQRPNTSLIEISIQDEDRMEAAAIANEIAKAYRAVRNGASSGVHVEILEQAEPAIRPNKPGRGMVVLLFSAAVLVFVVGLGLLIAGLISKKPSPLPPPLARAS